MVEVGYSTPLSLARVVGNSTASRDSNFQLSRVKRMRERSLLLLSGLMLRNSLGSALVAASLRLAAKLYGAYHLFGI
jgi:hypothetical protein